MNTILRDSTPTARKKHTCDGWCIIDNNNCGDYDLDVEKQMNICKRVIKKGQKYINQVGVYDGDFGNFKSCQGCHDICEKYNLYENE